MKMKKVLKKYPKMLLNVTRKQFLQNVKTSR